MIESLDAVRQLIRDHLRWQPKTAQIVQTDPVFKNAVDVTETVLAGVMDELIEMYGAAIAGQVVRGALMRLLTDDELERHERQREFAERQYTEVFDRFSRENAPGRWIR